MKNSLIFRLTILLALVLPAAVQAQGRALAQNKMREALQAVVKITAFIPEGARTAESLGTERAGSAVVIGADGLILTVGYLILEAERVVITTPDDEEVAANIVAYDFDTGFGLVRGAFTKSPRTATIGSATALKQGDKVYVASRLEDIDVAEATVVSRREYAGYWEYLLANAIFTAPQYHAFGGAPLFAADGSLIGIGSLALRQTTLEPRTSPGNMFIPVDHLKPILADLLTSGRRSGKEKPWFGIWSTETDDGISVTFVAPDSPAYKAGLRKGDVITAVEGQPLAGHADFYRKIWAAADTASEVSLKVRRGGDLLSPKLAAIGRSAWFRKTADK